MVVRVVCFKIRRFDPTVIARNGKNWRMRNMFRDNFCRLSMVITESIRDTKINTRLGLLISYIRLQGLKLAKMCTFLKKYTICCKEEGIYSLGYVIWLWDLKEDLWKNPNQDSVMDYKKLYSEYLEKGCLKIENFLSSEEIKELRQGLKDVVNNIPEENSHTFSVYGSGKSKEADEFFINSGSKVRYFFENDAFDSKGHLLLDKKEALNKVGYALHWWNPLFKKHTFSEKVKNLLRNFQYEDPVVVQSMLIFKKPKIGEIVNPHQDSTFLYTEPPTCIGLWFPLLEDVTLENGCLWFVPGSHKGKVHQRFVRNPAKNPLLLMEGTMPDFSDDQYVPVPTKIGDCVLIHGSVIHKSGRNTTNIPRTIYTYHVVENDAPWSEKNWVQPTETLPFPSVYDN